MIFITLLKLLQKEKPEAVIESDVNNWEIKVNVLSNHIIKLIILQSYQDYSNEIILSMFLLHLKFHKTKHF